MEETRGDRLAGSTGFNDVAGYIFGKNSTMTTPVFSQAKDLSRLPDPNEEKISLRKVERGTAGVMKFSGKPTEDIVGEKEKKLRASLVKDGLKPKIGCLLAGYNDPGRTWSFIMRNEVLIWLEEFSLE